MVDTQQVLAERLHKLKMEIESATRIEKLGLHPIDVLDDMFHVMMALRHAALKKNHPHMTDAGIIRMMREEEEAARRFKRRDVM